MLPARSESGALLSAVGPVGSVRALTGTPGPSLPVRVAVPAAALLVVALAAVAVSIVLVAQRRAEQTSYRSRRRTAVLSNTLSRFSRPSMTTGTSAALDVARPGTVAAILGCAVAVVSVVGSLTFGSTLTTLVEQPTQYGWPWDAAVITNGGFDGAVPENVAATLDGDRDVAGYGLYVLDSSTLLGDQGFPVVYGFSASAPFELPARRGTRAAAGERGRARHPDGPAARPRHRRSRRRPVVAVPGEASVEVVGTAVLPAVGSFVSDRAGLRDGAFVLTDEAPTSKAASFVAIDLRDGVDPDDFIRRLEPAFAEWDASGSPPLTYAHPVRSPEIVNVSELRSAPLLLGGVLGVALLGGLALSIMVSVRDRQRELAVLRALGFGDAQLRASVRWQACAMMVAGLLIGVPLGIIAGRLAWRVFADQLGVALRAGVPLLIVVATTAGAMVLAVMAAVVPARSATRCIADAGPGPALSDGR